MKTEVIKLYEDREDVTLTTYIWDDSMVMLRGKPRPAVLICPGGGYLNCSDAEAEPIAIKFASMGYHAFVLRYSRYMTLPDGTNEEYPDITKPQPPREYCQYPVQMREIGKSMLIIREHAEEWHVDVERIALCGFSAGAHNVAMYATHWQEDIISEYFGEEKEKFRPAAAILGYALIDYIYRRDTSVLQKPMDRAFFEFSNTAFLGEANPSEERLKEVSPVSAVSEYTPPTYLWATAGDDLVPVQHSIRMAHALADHKIPFEMHIFEEGPHGLTLGTQASAESKTQLYPDAAKWVDLAGCWLEKRFALPLSEKSWFEELVESGVIDELEKK